MKRAFRPRPGFNGDVVYEIRSLFWSWLPNTWNIGWKPYANAASGRNKVSSELNEMAYKFKEKLDRLAELEAVLAEERKDLKGSQHRSYDHLGVGDVIYHQKKAFAHMLPFVAEPEPEWKKLINKAAFNRAMQRHNVTVKNDKDDKPKNREVFTPRHVAEKLQNSHDSHVIAWDDKKERGSSAHNSGQKKSKGKKSKWIQLRSEFPIEDDENQNEWDARVRDEWGRHPDNPEND